MQMLGSILVLGVAIIVDKKIENCVAEAICKREWRIDKVRDLRMAWNTDLLKTIVFLSLQRTYHLSMSEQLDVLSPTH